MTNCRNGIYLVKVQTLNGESIRRETYMAQSIGWVMSAVATDCTNSVHKVVHNYWDSSGNWCEFATIVDTKRKENFIIQFIPVSECSAHCISFADVSKARMLGRE